MAFGSRTSQRNQILNMINFMGTPSLLFHFKSCICPSSFNSLVENFKYMIEFMTSIIIIKDKNDSQP